MKKKSDKGAMKVFGYYVYLLVVWGLFRLEFRFPDLIEELWIKPVVWLLPLFWIWFGEKKRTKFFKGNVVKALVWGFGLGLLYILIPVVAHLGKYGGFRWEIVSGNVGSWGDVLGIGLATAITQELVFSGYIYQRLKDFFGGTQEALLVTAGMFALIHVPISVFVYRYSGIELGTLLGLVLIVAVGKYWAMERTKNVLAPIMIHWLWGVAVFVFG